MCKILSTKIIEYGFEPKSSRSPEDFSHKSPWMQKLSETCSVQKDLTEEIDGEVENNRFQNTLEIHLDQRVALFFEQTIVCYNTPFHFTVGETEDQFGKSKTPNQAAHSSTLPCIHACPRSDFDNYIKQKESNPDLSPPKKFTYLKGSNSYYLHNSTNDLPKEINEVDSLIDWKAKDKETLNLRDSAIAIINQVALGILNPPEATKRFVKKLLLRIKAIKPKTEDQATILKFYFKHIASINTQLKNSNRLFDQMLSVKLNDNSGKSEIIRQIVYIKRYEVIQAAELIESRIAKRIESFCKENTIEKANKHLFKFVMLQQADLNLAIILKKLFCKTNAVFEEGYIETITQKCSYKTFNTKIKNLSSKINETALNNLFRDIRCDVRELNKIEEQFRAGLFSDFRTKVFKWTQKSFSNNFKEKFPEESMSQSMVSRLEQPIRIGIKTEYITPLSQRTKQFTLEKAKKCAEIFEVDCGLFFPALFTSR